MCQERFLGVTCGNNTMDADDLFIQKLKQVYESIRDNKTALAQFSDMHTFTAAILGEEGSRLLAESSRLNIFIEKSSVEAFFDFLEDEPTGTNEFSYRRYPAGGMSEYIKAMIQASKLSGVRLFNQKVLRISTKKFNEEDFPYVITTKSNEFVIDKLMIAVPPQQLKDIGGNIIENIINKEEFKLIVPIPVATVAAWFPNRWWENLLWNFTRVISRQICFNVMEIIPTPYIQKMNVIRVVYDEWNCLSSWKSLINGPTELLELEVMRGLKAMFPDVTIPKPTKVEGAFVLLIINI